MNSAIGVPGPIAVLAHAHPSISKGGAENAAYTLFQGLRRLGVPARFIAAVPRRLQAKLRLTEPEEHAVLYEEDRYDHFFSLATPAMTADLLALLQREKVTAVFFHHFFNFGAGALRAVKLELGLPVVVTLHEFLAMCAHHGQMVTRPDRNLCDQATPTRCVRCYPELSPEQVSARHDLLRGMLQMMDGYVSPSNFLARRFVEWGLPAERMTVIENGLSQLPAATLPPRGTRGKVVFCLFGQITPFKGANILLDAADLLGNDKKFVAGIEIRLHGPLIGQDDAFRARFERALAQHSFLRSAGPYENDAVQQLMQAADYVVVPSTWWENSPMVIQEAYAAERPVICSGIGGMAEKVVDGVTGLHFDMGDAADLARVIRLAALPKTRASFIALPKPLGATDMAGSYLQFLQGLTIRAPGHQAVNIPFKQ